MKEGQVDSNMIDRVLEMLNEAFSWVKTQVEAFFKLLWNELSKAFQSVKSLVINCCEKFKQVLARTNDLIDGGIQKVSETKAEEEKLKSPEEDKLKSPEEEKLKSPEDDKLKSPEGDKLKSGEENVLLDELKKLIQKMMTFVSYITKIADPELRRKGENLKGRIGLVEGFIELWDLSLKQPVQVILVFIDGFFIYRKIVNKGVGNLWDFPQHKNKAACAIAALLSLINIIM